MGRDISFSYSQEREAYSTLAGWPSLQLVFTDPVSSVQAARVMGGGGAGYRGIG